MSFFITFFSIFLSILVGGLIAFGIGRAAIALISATNPLVGLLAAVALVALIITFISKLES